MTRQDLQLQLKDSMLARNELRTSVLRMLISAINYYEINKGGANYQASEEDILTVLNNQAKQRRDSIEQYNNAGRHELAEKEIKELEILQVYLPKQMGEEEIEKLVNLAITQTQAKSIADLGKVMSALMPNVKGKADGTLVSNLVKKALTS